MQFAASAHRIPPSRSMICCATRAANGAISRDPGLQGWRRRTGWGQQDADWTPSQGGRCRWRRASIDRTPPAATALRPSLVPLPTPTPRLPIPTGPRPRDTRPRISARLRPAVSDRGMSRRSLNAALVNREGSARPLPPSQRHERPS